jgi:hypothetical protein
MIKIVKQLQPRGVYDKNTGAHSVKAKKSANMVIQLLVGNVFGVKLAEKTLYLEILLTSVNESFIGFIFGFLKDFLFGNYASFQATVKVKYAV